MRGWPISLYALNPKRTTSREPKINRVSISAPNRLPILRKGKGYAPTTVRSARVMAIRKTGFFPLKHSHARTRFTNAKTKPANPPGVTPAVLHYSYYDEPKDGTFRGKAPQFRITGRLCPRAAPLWLK